MSDAMDRALLNEFIDWRERMLTGDRDVSPQRFLQERDWVDLERRVEKALSYVAAKLDGELDEETRDALGHLDTIFRSDDDWTEELTIGSDTTVRRTNR